MAGGLRDRGVDQHVALVGPDHEVVSETQIATAMRYAMERLRLVVEGGGAVGLAAALERAPALVDGDGPVVILVSGGNVAASTLIDILDGEAP